MIGPALKHTLVSVNLWEKLKYAILVIIITCYIHAGFFVLFKPRPHLVSAGSPITGQTMKPRH